jgi:hypothetical protein
MPRPIEKKKRFRYTTNDSKPSAAVTAGVSRRFDDTASSLIHTTESDGEEYQSDFRCRVFAGISEQNQLAEF